MNYLYYNNTKSFLDEYNKNFPDISGIVFI